MGMLSGEPRAWLVSATAMKLIPSSSVIPLGAYFSPLRFKNDHFSLVRSVIHEVAKIPDAATIAGVRVLRRLKASTGHFVDAGPSSSLNFLVALAYANRHKFVSFHNISG